jgi:3-isopropylmalate/(R)-2-methylmalate dehydratase small subunit
MLPITLPDSEVEELMSRTLANEGYQLTIDLETLTIEDGRGFSREFKVGDFQRYCLLEGLDDIGLTMKHEALIKSYESSRPAWLTAP